MAILMCSCDQPQCVDLWTIKLLATAPTSQDVSRCLKMSQDVSRCLKSTFKASAKSAFFKDLCCLLCIWLVCHTIQVYEYRIRRIYMMHRTFILMIKTCKITLVCKLWWLPGTTCSVLFKRSDDSSSRCKKNAMSDGSVAIQKQPSSVDPAKGLRSPNWDLSNLFNMCFWINILQGWLKSECFKLFAIWRSKFGQFTTDLEATSADFSTWLK